MIRFLQKWLLLGLFCPVWVFGQTSQSALAGRVFAVQTDGARKGLEGVTLSIKDFDYDVSDREGHFELNVPKGRDFVAISVENASGQMLKPLDGIVYLPPSSGPIEVVLCGAQNQKLLDEAQLLKAKISKLQKAERLSARQLAALHDRILDTVAHYQKWVSDLQGRLDASKTAETAFSDISKAQERRIAALEDSIKGLQNALFEAVQARFLRQKAVRDEASADLQLVLDRLKDLLDRSSESRLEMYFSTPAAGQALARSIFEYNEAREAIVKRHKAQLADAKAFWDSPEVAERLGEAFDFFLEEAHGQTVKPLDARCFEQMRLHASGQKSRSKAEKEAKIAALELLPKLSAAIGELEKRIKIAIDAMANSI